MLLQKGEILLWVEILLLQLDLLAGKLMYIFSFLEEIFNILY